MNPDHIIEIIIERYVHIADMACQDIKDINNPRNSMADVHDAIIALRTHFAQMSALREVLGRMPMNDYYMRAYHINEALHTLARVAH